MEWKVSGSRSTAVQTEMPGKNQTRQEQNSISKFPDIVSYPLYAEPGYFKIRAGDFRTKTEATKYFY